MERLTFAKMVIVNVARMTNVLKMKFAKKGNAAEVCYCESLTKFFYIYNFTSLIRGTVTLCYIQVYDFQLTQRQEMHIAAIGMVRIPPCCMPKWHAHPTRHVQEFWIRIVMIRVPSIFVLN